MTTSADGGQGLRDDAVAHARGKVGLQGADIIRKALPVDHQCRPGDAGADQGSLHAQK
jgi:hypothetical protein